MSALRLQPDLEAAILAYLVAMSDITAIVSDRVYAELPPSVVYPAITCRTLSSRSGTPRWLEAVTLEVAGWSNRAVVRSRRQARDACETAVAAINALVNTTLDDCTICGPVVTTGPRSVPDTLSAGVTNPRFVAEVSLTYHPA